LGAEHAADRLVQRLAAVHHEQDPLAGGQATVGHHPQRDLGAIHGHPERADEQVLAHPEPVEIDHQPAPVVQAAGQQLGQAFGGGGHEPAGDRRLGGPGGLLLDLLADRLQPGGLTFQCGHW
jgi:hypothetical protein